jgi:hypothetical protein
MWRPARFGLARALVAEVALLDNQRQEDPIRSAVALREAAARTELP